MITRETSLKEILKFAPVCSCESCKHGCRVGSGILAKNDSRKIAKFLNLSEDILKKKYLEQVEMFNKVFFRPKILRQGKPYGKCIFFEDKCTIHKVKPLQCRITMGCKPYGEELSLWFMLNYIIDKDDAESIRQFALYLKSGGKTLRGGELKDFVPDRKVLNKILGYKILR